jgi:hypothetical protein
MQLLSNEEAVVMLCGQSYMDTNDAIPPEVFSIVRMCGNLPLCVCVVAGMVRANNEDSSMLDSIREVLAMLQDDRDGALAGMYVYVCMCVCVCVCVCASVCFICIENND